MRVMGLPGETAPSQPVLVYDADCNFCKYWAARWRRDTRHGGECVALQDRKMAERFPEIPGKELERAIHLIDTDGSVYAGAEAVFRFRAKNPDHQLLLRLYGGSRTFARVSDAIYHLVSHHRSFFSRIWGTHA